MAMKRSIQVLCGALLVIACYGRSMSALNQAVGSWEVKIRSSDSVLPLSNKRSTLSIFSNGTFALGNANLEQDDSRIQGIWNLLPNPYCPTDRFYDELFLSSYPRTQRRRSDGKVLKKGELRLKCRVSGRYGSHMIRTLLRKPEGRLSSRLTHGTITWKDQDQHQPTSKGIWGKLKQRRIYGTFSGKAIQSADESKGDESVDSLE